MRAPSCSRTPATPASRSCRADVANDVTFALKGVAQYSKRTLDDGREVASKTGTQGLDRQDNSDAWMVGYTPSLSTAVWMGTDGRRADHRLRGRIIYGSGLPGEIWQQFMNTVLAGTPEEELPDKPPSRATAARASPRRRRARRRRRPRRRPDPDLGGADAPGDPDRDRHLVDGDRRPEIPPPPPRCAAGRPSSPRERGRQQSGRQPGRGRLARLTGRAAPRHGTLSAVTSPPSDGPPTDPSGTVAEGSVASPAGRAAARRPRPSRPDRVVPSWSDPVVAQASEAVGGPWGRHAVTGGALFWTPLRVCLLFTAFVLALAWIKQAPCAAGDWSGSKQYTHLCYSDAVPLFGLYGLGSGDVPYLDSRVEYPVLTGAFIALAAALARGYDGLADGGGPAARPRRPCTATPWSPACCSRSARCCSPGPCWRLAGRRPWDAAMIGLSPILLVHAFTNWDLFAVALATLGMLAWARRRPVLAGVLLGLAVAAKFYPLLLLGALFLLCLRAGRLRDWRVTALAAVATWAAVNLPVAVLAPDNWAWFFVFSRTRAANPESLWNIAQHLSGDRLLDGPLAEGEIPAVLNARGGRRPAAFRRRRRLAGAGRPGAATGGAGGVPAPGRLPAAEQGLEPAVLAVAAAAGGARPAPLAVAAAVAGHRGAGLGRDDAALPRHGQPRDRGRVVLPRRDRVATSPSSCSWPWSYGTSCAPTATSSAPAGRASTTRPAVSWTTPRPPVLRGWSGLIRSPDRQGSYLSVDSEGGPRQVR